MNGLKKATQRLPTVAEEVTPPATEEEEEAEAEAAESKSPPPSAAEDETAVFRSLETCYVLRDDVHTASWLRAASVLIGKTQSESKLDQIRDVTLMCCAIALYNKDPLAVTLRTKPWYPAPRTEFGSMTFCNCPVTACFRWIAWLAHRSWACATVALGLPSCQLVCEHDKPFTDLKNARLYVHSTARTVLWFYSAFRFHYAYSTLLPELLFVAQALGGMSQLLFAVSPEARNPEVMPEKTRIQAVHQSIDMLELVPAMNHKLWVVNVTLINHMRGIYWAELGDMYRTKHALRESLWAYHHAVGAFPGRYRDELDRATKDAGAYNARTEPFDFVTFKSTYAPLLPKAQECSRMLIPMAVEPMEEQWLPDLKPPVFST